MYDGTDRLGLAEVMEVIGYNLSFWHRCQTGETVSTCQEIEDGKRVIRRCITRAARIRAK